MNYSEEEKKAIEFLKENIKGFDDEFSNKTYSEAIERQRTILNLIEKQQKEIENSVSKDKIRDKIKELENRAKEYGYYKTEIEYARNTLQEIIGE